MRPASIERSALRWRQDAATVSVEPAAAIRTGWNGPNPDRTAISTAPAGQRESTVPGAPERPAAARHQQQQLALAQHEPHPRRERHERRDVAEAGDRVRPVDQRCREHVVSHAASVRTGPSAHNRDPTRTFAQLH